MWESQVSGCQFPDIAVVKAQRSPAGVKPCCTLQFLTRFVSSS